MSAEHITLKHDNDSARPLDPNVLQRRASAPDTSVWVSASAGTGKTKVLTDRVLRLLLPRKDKHGNIHPGTLAHKILCLTFTKAAASEMALRVSETLASWAVMPLDGAPDQKTLKGELKKLLGREADDYEIKTARRLFADVVDVPGGLKIMTIHAFCQSILGRFPLEAGITPHFTVLEDVQATAMMTAAREKALIKAAQNKASPLHAALTHVAATINEDQFLDLLAGIARERRQFEILRERHFDGEGLYTKICETLKVDPQKSPDEILIEACRDDALNKAALQNAAQIMQDRGTNTDQKHGALITDFLSLNEQDRVQNFAAYQSAFLTEKKQPRAKLAGKDVCNADPNIPDILVREATRILEIQNQLKSSQTAALTRDLLILGQAVLEEYTTLKSAQAALDFDDLILRTLDLLHGKTMGDLNVQNTGSWVHYKLDQGLDHILIDEAQDTNPEQWKIIEALCNEFFEGTAQSDLPRTVFTVGDEKQSIYSFQRASPEEFARMQNDFAQKANRTEQGWDSVPMNISFRSTQSVLQAVDATFANPVARKGLGQLPVEHSAFRRGQAGHVELWPLFESDETIELDLWKAVATPTESQSGVKKLATHLARTIKGWLDNGEILESKNRKIRPGDIMILVRTRNTLVNQIARELKNIGIPVSGLDRMVLKDELAVQDMLCALQFALQPLDDLNLATLLKSPLINISEEALYNLAANRGDQPLWHRVREQQPLAEYLGALITAAKKQKPAEILSQILQSPCPADEISGRRAMMRRLGAEALDPLDELLSIARNFERDNPAALQNFIRFITARNTEIKREHHTQSDEVRIMTVHGSKGLQAPIVILPDTVSGPANAGNRAEKRLIWPNQTGLDIPLWSPRKDSEPAEYTAAMATVDERLQEEYRRLLYVAMTRAEDRLYIAGALNKKQNADKLPETCWYALVQTGLQTHPNIQTMDGEILQLSNPQTKDPEVGKAQSQKPDVPVKNENTPTWLFEKAPAEAEALKIFRPSQINDTSLSPLQNAGTHRFLRGNLIHKLLQLLPTLPRDQWQKAATNYIAHYGQSFGEDMREQMVTETLAVLNHPEFTALFGPESLAETPITGVLEGKGLISGQIDRLCITENEVLIIDYKTNRPPPKNPQDIPKIYQTQMQTYADILRQIYPGKPIKAALLWTDGPFLMPLELESV